MTSSCPAWRAATANSVDEMYAAIGYGGLQLARITPKLKAESTPRLKAAELKPLPTVDIKPCSFFRTALWWKALTAAPSEFAKCCSPLPGG